MGNNIFSSLAIATLLHVSISSNAQPAVSKQLDNYFDKIESRNKAMGSFSIFQNGQQVYQRSFGWASLEPKLKADSNSVYWIGSVSKTFTAAIILQLVEEGRLTLQDQLDQFFPDWPEAHKITIENLLRHQSGIHNFGEDHSGKYSGIDPSDRKEVLQTFKETDLDFEPGSRSEYNNANYLLLSMVAEVVDTASFSEILRTRISDKLKLRSTYLKELTEVDSNEVGSFYWRGGWHLFPSANLAHLKGAGGIVSTPNELNTFLQALFNHQLFSGRLLDEMTDLEKGMGIGIFRFPFGQKACYGHAGEIAGFETMAAYFPGDKIGFALCLNGTRIPMNDILIDVLKLYFGY